MTVNDIRTVAVFGAGTMGSGIAHVFARAGYAVILRDVEQRYLDRALEIITKGLDSEIKKGGLIQAEKQPILDRITRVTGVEATSGADLAIEAVPERVEVKSAVLAEAAVVLRPDAILATNTSSISITLLGAGVSHPERFVGMHFMNPVPVMPLVEVIRALQTGDEAFEVTVQLCEKIGKTPVAVNDSPGFVSNRVLMPMINEAAFCVMEGVATAESVDSVMKLGMKHPMGPLQLADFIGLDVCVDILEVLHSSFGDAKFAACPLLRKMVAAGWLGRKSGRGFYAYEDKRPRDKV